jgi:hypothetical protein
MFVTLWPAHLRALRHAQLCCALAPAVVFFSFSSFSRASSNFVMMLFFLYFIAENVVKLIKVP